MKKTISVFLAVLMLAFTLVPAFAAEVENTESEVKYNVTFQPPVYLEDDAYLFVKSVNGEIQYELDPDGDYVFFDGRYMLPSNIVNPEDIPEETYSPVEYTGTVEVKEGETVAFKVMTSEKYNVHTAAVFINGSPAQLNAQDDYVVYVDQDLYIHVAELDDETKEPVLLRNHYNVKLTSGDGYKLKTLKGENYEVTYYGESFDFRIYISEGYSASGIKVSVQRGQTILGDLFDEEDSDMLAGIIGGTETLTSYGVDAEGCRLYRIENITTDCKVIVSGLQEEANVGVMAFLKRILRLILNFFGIKLDILDSFTAYYNVNIDASQADGVTYQVLRSAEDELSPTAFTVTGGEGITILVTKKDPNQDVNVRWTPGNELGTYKTDWLVDYNTITGEVSYVAVYNIDNITADTQIIIS